MLMGGTNSGTHIDTAGGAAVGGSVTAGRDFVGRDQLNIYLVLGKLDDVAAAVNEVLRAQAQGQPQSVNAVMVAAFMALMMELRRTHATVVRLVNPLRRVADAPATFAADFKPVYDDFRDFYDVQDWINERTHCSLIREIKGYMLSHAQANTPAEAAGWQALETSLNALDNFDTDLIEMIYVPFVNRVNATLKEIDARIMSHHVDEAIALKQNLLAILEPQYDKTRDMLNQMNATFEALKAQMDDG
jgi:hypothetical protein